MPIRKLKMLVSYLVKAAMFYGGGFALLRWLRPNRKVAILRYHAVVDANNDYVSPAICLSLAQFERHVKYFARAYNIISLDEAVQALRERRELPPNSVVFTFDDGYADNFQAGKILKRYGGTGTFYLTAACIDRQEPFWLSEVIYLVLKSNRRNFTIEQSGRKLQFNLSSRRERWKTIGRIVELIKSNNRAMREEVRQQVRQELSDVSFVEAHDHIMLNWQQVEEMCEDGMTMGGHTMTHLNLPNADPPDAELEIRECKKLLETRLRRPILHFSYPNSGPYKYYTEDIRNLVEKSGYSSSTTSFFGYADANSDLFALRRVRTVPSLIETVAGLELSRFF